MPLIRSVINIDNGFIDTEAILDEVRQKCAVPGSFTALVGFGGVG